MRRILIIAFLICLAGSSMVLSGCTSRADWFNVDIDKSIFDDAEPFYNDNYNSMNGLYDYRMDLARTDDAFYFKKYETRTETVAAPVYLKDFYFETIYRTDKNGTKIVYDGKETNYQGDGNELRFYDGKLLEYRVHNESGEQEIWYLNEDKRQYEMLFAVELPNNEELNFFDVINGRLILFCTDSSIYEYKDGNYEKLPIEPAYYGEDSYVSDYCANGFYYYDFDYDDDVNGVTKKVLYRYDLDKRKTVAVYDFGKIKADSGFNGYEVFPEVVTDNYYYTALSDVNQYGGHCRFYRIDLNNMTADLIFETDEDIQLNAAGGCAYVGFCENQKGLYKITPDSNELIKLSDDATAKIFIADDKWIYFSGNRGDIKRIHPDGEGVETAIKVKTAT